MVKDSRRMGLGSTSRRLRALIAGAVYGRTKSQWQVPDSLAASAHRARSVFIRFVDAGSGNDCNLEVSALANPYYDFERFGFRLVVSPCHADVLLVSGPITRSMLNPLHDAFEAMARPRTIITMGHIWPSRGEHEDPRLGTSQAPSFEDDLYGDSYAVAARPSFLQGELPGTHINGAAPPPEKQLTELLRLRVRDDGPVPARHGEQGE